MATAPSFIASPINTVQFTRSEARPYFIFFNRLDSPTIYVYKMLGTEDEKPGSSSAPDAADVEQQEESGPPEDIDAEALELMGQGKRNLVVGDPPAAVQCFQEACELLASKYGETAEECGDAYYQYGCSLLELASMENGVLGNALQGVPEDSADSADSDDEGAEKPSGSTVESADKLEAKEREEVIQQVKDALEANCESEESEKEDKGKEGKEGEEDEEEKMEEGGDNKEAEASKQEDEKKDDKEELKEEKKDEKKVEEKKVEEKEKESGEEKKDVEKKVEEKDEKKEEEKKGEGKSEKEVEKKDTEKTDDADKTEKKEKKEEDDDDDGEEAGPSAEDDQKEDGDDISNFQLAWEMLELSRVIISKKEDEESQMKTSQIHLKLGELGLETEQYTQSIVDFKACLDIQKKYLDPESRLIAGTHYNLGLACSFAQQFDESIEHYRESKQLIEKRLASLEKKVSETEGKGKEKADENDPIVCAQKEMDELKELLPDVVSKLEDAKEMKLQAASSSAGAGPSSSTSTGFAPSSSGFAPSSSSEPVQQIAVRKKRKPEESDAAADSKRSRQEENGEKPALNGSGDTKVVNGNGQMANGVMNGDMNGDSKHSPEKPAEIKTKKLAQDGEAPAAMETS